MAFVRKTVSMILTIFIVASSVFSQAFAEEAYIPYNYDAWGDSIPSQTGYVADYFVDGNTIGCGAFKEISDIFVTEDGRMFIVDKGNSRIVVTDLEFNLIKVMTEFYVNGVATTLKNPMGIFVDRYTDDIYIADYDNSRVIRCDYDGNVLFEFTKPTDSLYDQQLSYNPEKVLCDKAGNVYVVVGSVTRGSVMFDKNGEFMGFYGANRVEQTADVIANAFWSLISTEEQQERTIRSAPIGFSNFDVDDDGFIYTVSDSPEVDTDVLKKLNPSGENILDAISSEDHIFGDIPLAYYSIYAKKSSLTDIDIGPNGELNILDYQHGRIFQYDKEATLLFIIGGTGEQLGTFLAPIAIESFENKMYVADGRKNSITVFTRNAFGEIVTDATNLYNDGLYEEALVKWENVLKYDGNYRLAYSSIGNALFNQGKFDEAKEYYEDALKQTKYDKSFGEIRDEFLRQNYEWMLAVIVILVALFFVLKYLIKKGIIKPITIKFKKRKEDK